MCRSVPQIEVAWTRTRTSPSPGDGMGMSTSSAPACGAVFRKARMVPGMGRSLSRRMGTSRRKDGVQGRTPTQEERTIRLKLFGATVLSLGLLAGACANSSGDGSGGGGTGSTGSTGATGSTGTTSPNGSDQVVLRIEQSGGIVAVQYNLTRMPMLSRDGDGLYLTPGPQIEIYPGPALPAIAQQRLTPEAVQLLLQA